MPPPQLAVLPTPLNIFWPDPPKNLAAGKKILLHNKKSKSGVQRKQEVSTSHNEKLV
jgi:hypothetical protein